MGGPLLALLLLALLLALAEGGLRLSGWEGPPTPDSHFQTDLNDPNHRAGGARFWDLRPGNPSWEVNAAGFRAPGGEELPRDKPPGEIRLAFLGDSSVFGWCGVDGRTVIPARETFAHQVELLLNAGAGPGERYRSLNFGVPGYTTYQGVSLLRERVLRYEPDLVLTYFGANDLSHAALSDRERARVSRLRRSLLRLRLFSLFSSALRAWRRPGPEHQAPGPDHGAMRVGDRRYALNQAAMARLAREAGARLVVLGYLWAWERGADSGREIRSDPAVRVRPDKLFIDLLGPMRRAQQQGSGPLFFDSCHPTGRGHMVLARAIARGLNRLGLVQPGAPR